MDYQFVTEANKREAVLNRLAQLESEHLSNTYYLEEAKLLQNFDEVNQLSAVLKGLELRIDAYREKLTQDEPAE